jgi:alpha-galactosidase
MTAWAESEMPKPKPPGYVKMPGRPKKSRRREPGEKAKRTKMAKIGGKIRCSKCKATGHNTTTCDRRHGTASEPIPGRQQGSVAGEAASSPAANNALVTHGSLLIFLILLCNNG